LVETTSWWGADEPSDISSVLDPYGESWLIDRRRFDRELVDAAVDAGAVLVSGQAIGARRHVDGRWLVAARTDGRDVDIRGDWVVDATGRAAWLVRQSGFRRRIERLTATGRRYDVGRVDARLLIESVSTGWWYSVPSFDGALIVVHIAAHPLDDDDWETAISAAPLTAEPVGRGTVAGPSWVRPAGSSLSYVTGSNLLAVGDAMVSFDPVTGDGLSFAVVSGIEAAATIEAATRGDTTARDRYLRGAELLFARYRENRRQVYGDEHRWPDAPFWTTQRAS
jgi:flavin-dependent dehydrogenase